MRKKGDTAQHRNISIEQHVHSLRLVLNLGVLDVKLVVTLGVLEVKLVMN